MLFLPPHMESKGLVIRFHHPSLPYTLQKAMCVHQPQAATRGRYSVRFHHTQERSFLYQAEFGGLVSVHPI